MQDAILNAGLGIAFSVETTAGTMPTSDWVRIPKLTNIPSLYSTPDTQDTTTFDNLKYTSSIPGLQTQEVKEATMILNNDTWAMWSDVCDKYEEAEAEGKAMWFCHYHPKLSKANFYKGVPTRIVLDGGDPNNPLTVTLPITPSGEIVEDDCPTSIAEYTPPVSQVNTYSAKSNKNTDVEV